MAPARISFYGNFGAGNLGNEATLQSVIERVLRRSPDALLSCFCANPDDVRARHGIEALPAAVGDGSAARRSNSIPARAFRIGLKRLPVELAHWIKCWRALRSVDMLIIAGTGIVCDYTTGPSGYPYAIFKLSTLAAARRVKLIFLSVGVGPIQHPLSRWLLKTSLILARHRSYRDEASKRYLQDIGFVTDRDSVYPDVVFGLAKGALVRRIAQGQTRKIGLGIKDYASTNPEESRRYLDTMATFVSWLQGSGYGVRLLIGDIQYDSSWIDQFVSILKNRNIPAEAPFLFAEPALTVDELLRQVGETEAVVSARYHNLVMALIQNKPVIALSDHAKLDSVVTDFGLADYLVPLRDVSAERLFDKFRQLESNINQLRPRLKVELEKNQEALDELYASVLGEARVAPRLRQLGGSSSRRDDGT